VGSSLLWRLGGKGNLLMVPLFDALEFFMRSISCEKNVCDIKREEESMEGSYNFYFCNGKWLWVFKCLAGAWFHLKYDNVKDNSEYNNHVKFCCVHIVVICFSYKNDKITIICLAFKIRHTSLPLDDSCQRMAMTMK